MNGKSFSFSSSLYNPRDVRPETARSAPRTTYVSIIAVDGNATFARRIDLSVTDRWRYRVTNNAAKLQNDVVTPRRFTIRRSARDEVEKILKIYAVAYV